MLTNNNNRVGTVAGKILAAVPALALMLMIFMFSQADGTESSGMSGRICMQLAQLWKQVFHPEWDDLQLATVAENITFLVRKTAHVTEYFLLTLSYLLCLRYTVGMRWQMLWWGAGLATFLYACSDELHQRFIAGRTGKFTDVLIDCIGAVLAIGSVALIRLIRGKCNDKADCSEEQE